MFIIDVYFFSFVLLFLLLACTHCPSPLVWRFIFWLLSLHCQFLAGGGGGGFIGREGATRCFTFYCFYYCASARISQQLLGVGVYMRTLLCAQKTLTHFVLSGNLKEHCGVKSINIDAAGSEILWPLSFYSFIFFLHVIFTPDQSYTYFNIITQYHRRFVNSLSSVKEINRTRDTQGQTRWCSPGLAGRKPSPFICILSLLFFLFPCHPFSLTGTHRGVLGRTMVILFTREGLASSKSPNKCLCSTPAQAVAVMCKSPMCWLLRLLKSVISCCHRPECQWWGNAP